MQNIAACSSGNADLKSAKNRVRILGSRFEAALTWKHCASAPVLPSTHASIWETASVLCFTFTSEEKRMNCYSAHAKCCCALFKVLTVQNGFCTPHFSKWSLLQRFFFRLHRMSCAFILFIYFFYCFFFSPCHLIHTNINTGSLSRVEKPSSIQGHWCAQLNSMWRLSARKTIPTSHWLSIPLSLLNRATCQSDRKRWAEDTHLHSLPPANQLSAASGCAQTSLLN